MLRISKLTDYGIVVLAHVAQDLEKPMHNVPDLAAKTYLPAPTVSKILKKLSRAGLVVSHRGVKGGYSLAKPPAKISVAEIIAAIEGRIALTECSTNYPGLCDLEPVCPVRSNWRKINQVVRRSLENLSLLDMTRPLPQPHASPARAGDGSPQLVLVATRHQREGVGVLATRRRGRGRVSSSGKE